MSPSLPPSPSFDSSQVPSNRPPNDRSSHLSSTPNSAGFDASDARVRLANDALPPVEPPSAGFVVQLFFIPLVIVSLIVGVWLMFSWIAHAGSNPRALVAEIRKNNDASWQKAFELANLLRNSDADAIKDDEELAGDLCTFLDAELAAGLQDEAKVKLREFLCGVLGQFRVGQVVPTLVEAVRTQKSSVDLRVRTAAVEALTVHLSNVGAERVAQRNAVRAVLLDASRSRSDNPDERPKYDQLRSSAAFALGVLGDEESLGRLSELLDDGYANVRFNAALGLARHGDPRAIDGLIDMLDPDNPAVTRDETNEGEKTRKRIRVLKNAIRATARFWEVRHDLPPGLLSSIEKLSSADVAKDVQMDATDLLLTVRRAESGGDR